MAVCCGKNRKRCLYYHYTVNAFLSKTSAVSGSGRARLRSDNPARERVSRLHPNGKALCAPSSPVVLCGWLRGCQLQILKWGTHYVGPVTLLCCPRCGQLLMAILTKAPLVGPEGYWVTESSKYITIALQITIVTYKSHNPYIHICIVINIVINIFWMISVLAWRKGDISITSTVAINWYLVYCPQKYVRQSQAQLNLN